MKNLFKSLMLVAVAAMAFTSCQNDVNEVNDVAKETVLKFETSFVDTRVTIDNEKNENNEYLVTWDGNEEVLFNIQDGGWWDNQPSKMTVDPNNSRSASFEVILTGYAEGASADMGSTIYAHFGKISGWSNNLYASIAGETQKPTADGVDKSFVSMVAEFPVEEEGQMLFNGTFEHKTAYGVITLPESVKDIDFKTLTIKVNGEKEYILDVAGLEDHSYWFACEPDTVTSIYVSATDTNDTIYGYTASELNKTFKSGVVSRFSIKSLDAGAAEPVQLEMSEVTVTVEGNIATLSWAEVEGASSYAVAVNSYDGEYVNVGNVTEYSIDLSGYAPFSTIYVFVKAVGTGHYYDSYPSDARVSVPISKNAKGDTGFDFEYTQVEELGSNKYKFYNSDKEYMLIHFKEDITALEAGSYTYEVYDGVNYGEDSAFRHPQYTNGGYVVFYFQDTNIFFVDKAADGKYTITAFCKRWVDNGEYLFKGTWTGKLVGSVEPEPELKDPETVELLYASATPAPSSILSGNAFNVTFVDGQGKEYLWQVQTLGNKYLEVGDWNQSDYTFTEVGYVNYMEWPGISAWPFNMNVAIVDGQYDINLSATDNSYYGGTGLTHTAHFKGKISGMTLPGVEPEPESSASAALVTDTTFGGFNPYDVTFSFANGDKVVARFNTSGNQYLHLGAWQNNSYTEPHYISTVTWNGDDAYISACNVAYENNAYTVTFSVVFEYNNYTTINYTYTGAIVGLNAPGDCDCFKEPEQPAGAVGIEFVLCEEMTPAIDYDWNYTAFGLWDSEQKNYIRLEFNSNTTVPENGVTYTFDPQDSSYSMGTLSGNGVWVGLNGFAQAGISDYGGIVPTSGTVAVTVNGDIYTLVIDFVLPGGSKFAGTYVGTLPF